MKCTGDDSEVCGGRDAISVYSGSCSTPAPTPREHPHNDLKDDSASGTKNIGCYKDDRGDRVLSDAQTESKNMNAEVGAYTGWA